MKQDNLLRLDNIGIVVRDLEGAIAFFCELGLEVEGRATVGGQWVDRIIGLTDARSDIAVLSTPDGHSKLELTRFHPPNETAPTPDAPVNAHGYSRVMFAVRDIDDTVARLKDHGAALIGEIVQYEDMYRLCYLRGPEGIIIALAERIDGQL